MTRWTNPLFLRCDRGGRMQLGQLVDALADGTLIVPPYQRPRMWSRKQQAAWVGHVLSGAPCPAIFVRHVDGPAGPQDEILDGQQRLMACLEWLGGYWPARIPWSGEMAWCGTEECGALLRRRYWPVETLPRNTTDQEALQLYLDLNSGGTPHHPDELARVRALIK